MSVTAEPRLHDAARTALARATDHLLSLQHPDGWWKGELETNVTIDAEDIFLRHYLRLPDVAETTRRSAVWIRAAPEGVRTHQESAVRKTEVVMSGPPE